MKYGLKDSWKVTVSTKINDMDFTFDFFVSYDCIFKYIEAVAKNIIVDKLKLKLSTVTLKSISLASTNTDGG